MVLLPTDAKAEDVALPDGSLRVHAWVTEEGLVVAPDLVERCAVKMARYLLREVARRRAGGNTEPVLYDDVKIDIEVPADRIPPVLSQCGNPDRHGPHEWLAGGGKHEPPTRVYRCAGRP